VAKGSLDIALGSDQVRRNCDVEVRWHPYFIRPTIIENPLFQRGVTPGEHGTPAGPYWLHIADKAKPYGLDMSGGIKKWPAILYSHRLLHWAFKTGGWQTQHHLSGLIFKAFYADSVFLGVDNLAKLAGQAGLDSERARSYLLSNEDADEVKAQAQRFMRSGVSGVPYFYINGKPMFSGAQQPETFTRSILNA